MKLNIIEDEKASAGEGTSVINNLNVHGQPAIIVEETVGELYTKRTYIGQAAIDVYVKEQAAMQSDELITGITNQLENVINVTQNITGNFVDEVNKQKDIHPNSN